MPNTLPPQQSKILKYAALLLAAAAVIGAGLWGYSAYVKSSDTAQKRAAKDAEWAAFNNGQRAITWCNRADKKLKAGKTKEAVTLYDRCADVPGDYGKDRVIGIYMNGKATIHRDIVKADALIQQLEGDNKAFRLSQVATFYKGGIGGPVDVDKAVKYWQRAGEMGLDQAWANLATHYSEPKFIDLEKAAYFSAKVEGTALKQSTDIRAAKKLLAASFPEERQKGIDILQAVVDARTQVDGRDTAILRDEAATALAEFYLSPKQKLVQGKTAAALLDTIKNPQPRTLVLLADTYRLGLRGEVDMAKATALYQTAASKNVPDAYLALGHIHRLGMGVPTDAQEALSYYQRYKDAVNHGAHFIGYLYESGELGTPNYAKAYAAYQHGITRGNVTASVLMARLYERGLGVEKDEAKAFAMMSEAGLRGSKLARESLADYHTRGIGTAPNPNTARIWRDKIRPPKDPLAFICDICDPQTD